MLRKNTQTAALTVQICSHSGYYYFAIHVSQEFKKNLVYPKILIFSFKVKSSTRKFGASCKYLQKFYYSSSFSILLLVSLLSLLSFISLQKKKSFSFIEKYFRFAWDRDRHLVEEHLYDICTHCKLIGEKRILLNPVLRVYLILMRIRVLDPRWKKWTRIHVMNIFLS